MQIASIHCAALGLMLIADPTPSVKLRSYDYSGVGKQVMERAQRRVSFVLQKIGVKVEWVTDDEPQFRILIIEQMNAIMAISGDVFGYTPKDPDGTASGLAYVAYAPIRVFVRTPEPGRPRLDASDMLAYCIAHEIGHLLLPAGSHSSTGIMRARWQENDFKLMATGSLWFTPEHGKLIKSEALRLSKQH
jgi:hypothetical protein